jgi:hypothetical protein
LFARIKHSFIHPLGDRVINTRFGEIQRIQSEGRAWTGRTLKSDNADVEVTLVDPCRRLEFLLSGTRVATTLLPLLVCIPFLLFPAWLSIRIAMRPWNKVVNEVSLRPSDDLSPLKEVPKHKELRQMVDAINLF